MIAKLIPLAITISLALMAFCIGMNARAKDVLDLLRRPSLLARSLFSMFVVLPAIVVFVVTTFDLNRALLFALVAMALAPIPPLLPKKQLGAGGTASYAVGLLVIAALVSIFYIPLSLELLGQWFGRPFRISAFAVAQSLGITLLVPLVLGFAVRAAVPAFADRAARPLSLIASVLLPIGMLPILIASWDTMTDLMGNFTLVAIVAFTLAGLVVGHALGGPDPGDRTVLALATASRHPGVAIAIIRANAPDNKEAVVAVLLALFVGGIASLPYVKWRTRLHTQVSSA